MALKMVDKEVGDVTVLEIEGRIVLGEESNAFREQVKSLLAAGKKKIVLNLAQVGYIDSAGLGTLVATFHSARSQGAVLKLRAAGVDVDADRAIPVHGRAGLPGLRGSEDVLGTLLTAINDGRVVTFGHRPTRTEDYNIR